MNRFRVIKHGSLIMTGLLTSTLTGSVIFADSLESQDEDDKASSLSKVYRSFKKTFAWSKIDEVDGDPTLSQSEKNKAHYINNLQLRQEYQSPKYPIVLCHGLSGFDRLIVVPSFNLLSRLLMGKDLSEFSAIEENGGLSLDYWVGIKEALEENGSTVLVARVSGFGSIQQRADELNSFITKHAEHLRSKPKEEIYNKNDKSSTNETFKQKDDKVKINLIAHSMGGLDCRYLISELEKKNYEIVSLTTITTPHTGSEVADYCVELAKNFPTEIKLPPSIYQLTTSYLKEFNEQVKNDPKVQYLSYGASSRLKWYNMLYTSWSIINQKASANDGMVSVSSSKWGTYLGTLNNVDHLDLINWTSVFKRVASSVNPHSNHERIDIIALYLDIADNLAKRGF